MEKLHKESRRIVAAIKKAGTPNYNAQVNVGDFVTFVTIASEVSRECHATFVMLGATVDRNLYLATIAPADKGNNADPWMQGSVTSLLSDNTVQTVSSTISPYIALRNLAFSAESEQSPFKAIDQVFSLGSMWLKRNGLVEEEEEEHEYGFDDI